MPMASRSVGSRPSFVEQSARGRLDPAEHGLRALGDRDGCPVFRLDPAGEVADRDAHVRGADVDAEHDPPARGDGELGRRPAAGRDGVADRPDEPEAHEGVDAQGDRGPREPGHRRELGAGAGRPSRRIWNRSLVTDEPEGVDVPVGLRNGYVGHEPI